MNAKRPARALLIVALLLYPFAVYLGLKADAHAWLGLALIGFGVFRLWAVARHAPSGRTAGAAMAAVMICFGAAALLARDARLLLFYPCLMSMTAFSLFALSMAFPPTLIERFARMREPGLPAEAVGYCRRVNLIWCVFLAANTAVAVWTALQANHRIWLLYNGFLSYVLMGALFAGELIVRTTLVEHRTVCPTESGRGDASRARREEGAGWAPATDEQRGAATQIGDLTTEGKPFGAQAGRRNA